MPHGTPSTPGSGARRSAFDTRNWLEPSRRSASSDSRRSTSVPCPAYAITCPFVLDDRAVEEVARTVIASGLEVRSINGDIGDLNGHSATARAPVGRRTSTAWSRSRSRHRRSRIGAAVRAIEHTPIETLDADIALVARRTRRGARLTASRGVELWTESLHLHRLCWNLERAQRLPTGCPTTSESSWTSATSSPPAETPSSSSTASDRASRTFTSATPCRGNDQPLRRQRPASTSPADSSNSRPRIPRPLLARTRNARHHPRTATCSHFQGAVTTSPN